MPAIHAVDPYQAIREELAVLHHQVPGVDGCLIAGVDGLLILHDSRSQAEPHDIAAMAAAAHGIGRTFGAALNHGTAREVTVRSQHGYVAVYALGDLALLAVVGGNALNIARLHIEARTAADRLAPILAHGTRPH